ncbi:hypothetical protein VTN02DRAFT_3514 [Thermoascus thermophilus]
MTQIQDNALDILSTSVESQREGQPVAPPDNPATGRLLYVDSRLRVTVEDRRTQGNATGPLAMPRLRLRAHATNGISRPSGSSPENQIISHEEPTDPLSIDWNEVKPGLEEVGSEEFQNAEREHKSTRNPIMEDKIKFEIAKPLRELISSIPAADQDEAESDKNAVTQALRKFTNRVRSDCKGGWKVKGLKTSLYHHQLLGTAFMRDRENSSRKPFGGFLCDVMGFGKTIQALANILDGAPTDENDPERTTLIVVPSHLVNHWASQIEKHCEPGALGSILHHHAKARMTSHDPVNDFQMYGVIITTYEEIRSSYPDSKAPDYLKTDKQIQEWWEDLYAREAGPLHRIKFRRIILDEGHVIKNPESKVSIAVRALVGRYKWILSGTPLHNCNKEFYPYFDFLGVPHIGRYEAFVNKYCCGDELSNQRLVNIVRSILVRRTHSARLFSLPILTLPDVGERIVYVRFCDAEEKIYHMTVSMFIERINGLSGQGQKDSQTRCILTMLLKLRMLACHLLADLLSDSSPSPPSQASSAKQKNKNQQPRSKQKKKGIFDDLTKPEDDDYDETADWIPIVRDLMPSAKLTAARNIIAAWLAEAPDTKVVIFTQFRSVIQIFSYMCQNENWGYALLTGEMTFAARDVSIQEFRNMEELRVMIASLKAGGIGLDLTMANKCILVDPWWNEAVQQQAFCRLFRIGQVKNVEVVKLVVKDTIEDNILNMQVRKTAEIDKTIGDDALSNSRCPVALLVPLSS